MVKPSNGAAPSKEGLSIGVIQGWRVTSFFAGDCGQSLTGCRYLTAAPAMRMVFTSVGDV
jgi:hypothetical protein